VEQITALTPELVVATAENAEGRTTVVDAQMTLDQTDTTKIVLDIVEVAERNGLKLPREFGLILKQALYFDRYQKILAPSMDPLAVSRDASVRERLGDGVMECVCVSLSVCVCVCILFCVVLFLLLLVAFTAAEYVSLVALLLYSYSCITPYSFLFSLFFYYYLLHH
jgi:hypothetical protein